MSGEIEVVAEGHLAADALVKATPKGRELVELRLAVGVRRRDEDGTWSDVRTDWFDVTAWGDYLVSCLSQLKRGQRVVVVGQLTPGAYLSKSGEAVSSNLITARTVSVVPKAPAKEDDSSAPAGRRAAAHA